MAKFLESWFSQQSCDTLADLATSVASIDGNVVEVGCWAGRSTCVLANAVHPTKVHAVDTWAGSPGEISEYLAGCRDIAAEFRANVEDLTAGNVQMFWMDWRLYFTDHAGPTKFLHIDAAHTYDEVKANIEAALPHMVPGGVMCGDDAHHPPVIQAVTEVFGASAIRREASLWIWRAP